VTRFFEKGMNFELFTTCIFLESIYIHPISPRSILIESSHLGLGLPSGICHLGVPTKNLYTPLLSPIRATRPVHLILLDFITRTILGEEYRPLSSSICSFLQSPLTSSLSGTNIHLNTLFSNTLSPRSSLNFSDQHQVQGLLYECFAT
jgi:hypothetical protein